MYQERVIRWILGWILLVCLISPGCSREQRARANPLDPRNPTTEGRPQGFQAIAGHEQVGLSWRDISVSFLAGYRLYRQEIGGERTWTDIAGESPPSQFVDKDVENGKTYVYMLSALIGETLDDVVVESPVSDSVVATPGPEVCWVLDEGSGELVKVSPDARSVSDRVASVFGARHLAVDFRDGACWATTRFGRAGQRGIAVRFSAQAVLDVVVSGFSFPFAVAVDPHSGAAWIADIGAKLGAESKVVRVSDTGALLRQLSGFIEPVALAVDPNTGYCWIADAGAGAVTQVDPVGNVRFVSGNVGQPVALAVDPITGACWGIDNDARQVFKLEPDGTRTVTVTGLMNPVRLACNPFDGTCWIVDREGVVILLQTSVSGVYDILQRQDFHTIVTGFVSPEDVSVDAMTGNVWISDPGRPMLAKMTPDGRFIRQLTGLAFPVAVAIDPGPRQVPMIP